MSLSTESACKPRPRHALLSRQVPAKIPRIKPVPLMHIVLPLLCVVALCVWLWVPVWTFSAHAKNLEKLLPLPLDQLYPNPRPLQNMVPAIGLVNWGTQLRHGLPLGISYRHAFQNDNGHSSLYCCNPSLSYGASKLVSRLPSLMSNLSTLLASETRALWDCPWASCELGYHLNPRLASLASLATSSAASGMQSSEHWFEDHA